jgi:hypothetical protein
VKQCNENIKSRFSGLRAVVKQIQRGIYELKKKRKISIDPNEFTV